MSHSKHWFLTLLMLTAFTGLWAEPAPPVPAGHWSVVMLRDLALHGYLSPLPERSGYPREEMARYVAQALQQVPETPGAATADDLDNLYKLIQEYQAEMMMAGIRLEKIEDQLFLLRLRREQFRQRQDKIEAEQMPLVFAGQFWFGFEQLNLYGPNRPVQAPVPISIYRTKNVTRSAQINRDVKTSLLLVTRGQHPYGHVDISAMGMSNFNNAWNNWTFVGITRIHAIFDTPVGVLQAGDLQLRLTPLTFGYADDDDYYPFEPWMFRRKTMEAKERMGLNDHALPLSGVSLRSTLRLLKTYDLDLTTFVVRMGRINDRWDPDNQNIHEQIGTEPWTTALRLENHNPEFGSFGCTAVHFQDIGPTEVQSSILGQPEIEQLLQVGSADASLRFGGVLDASLEGAYSRFNPNVNDVNNPAFFNHSYEDLANTASLSVRGDSTTITATYSDVGPMYYNFMAQSRIYDPYMNFYNMDLEFWPCLPLYSQNLAVLPPYQWDVQSTTYTGHPRYNRRPWHALYGWYSIFQNNTFPYGAATPNRTGYTLQLQGNYWGHTLYPLLRFDNYDELLATVGPNTRALSPRTFQVALVGMTLDMRTMEKGKFPFPMSLLINTGLKQEQTNNGIANDVSLKTLTWSTGLDYGIEWVQPDMRLVGAYKNIAGAGREYTVGDGAGALAVYDFAMPIRTEDGGYSPTFNMAGYNFHHIYETLHTYDVLQDIYGAAIYWPATPYSDIIVGWTHTAYADNLDPRRNYKVDEMYSKWNVSF